MSKAVWKRETHLSPGPSSAQQAQDFVGLQLWQNHHEDIVGDVQVVAGHLVAGFLAHTSGSIDVALEGHPFCVVLTVHTAAPLPALPQTQGASEPGERPVPTDVVSSVEWGADTDAQGGRSVWVMFALQPPTFREWVAGG